jgi:hypothetical protein
MPPARPPLHVFGRDFYVKTAVASALVGAAMELFMIKTGFYDKVTVIEAERLVDVQAGNAPEFGKRAPDPWAHRQ